MEKTKSPDIRHELKALGTELAQAFKQIRSSDELHDLEHEIAVGLRKITVSIGKSVKAAAKAEQTAKIGRRLRTVAAIGAAEGKTGAVRAGRAAGAQLRKVAHKLKAVSRRFK